MKTEYAGKGGCLQRDSVEHKEYAEAYSTESQEVDRKDGAYLLEKVLDRENLNKAYKRVKANKGASGVDGMTVDEALPWLKEHREELLDQIRNGKYKPSPVRRVEIPKDNGGVRKLGIPTVIDRIIQQAIAQVLTPIYEPMGSLLLDCRSIVADLYGVELLGRDLFFEFSPLDAAVQHLQHDPGAEPEPTDEHLALVEIVQLRLVVPQFFQHLFRLLREQRRQFLFVL